MATFLVGCQLQFYVYGNVCELCVCVCLCKCRASSDAITLFTSHEQLRICPTGSKTAAAFQYSYSFAFSSGMSKRGCQTDIFCKLHIIITLSAFSLSSLPLILSTPQLCSDVRMWVRVSNDQQQQKNVINVYISMCFSHFFRLFLYFYFIFFFYHLKTPIECDSIQLRYYANGRAEWHHSSNIHFFRCM